MRQLHPLTLFPYTTLFRSIADVLEAASGINLWREWAKLEVADARPRLRPRKEHAGIILSLAKQEYPDTSDFQRSEEHTSELQSRQYLVCRLLLEKKKIHSR